MHSLHMRLRALLFGRCSAICEKLLSAVRSNGRKAFAMVILLSMGVTMPVFADDYDIEDAPGYISSSNSVFFYVETNTTSASARRDWFGYDNSDVEGFPLTATLLNGLYVLDSTSVDIRKAGVRTGGYIDFIFSMPDSGVLDFSHLAVYATVLRDNSRQDIEHEFDDEIDVALLIDGEQVGYVSSGSKSVLDFPLQYEDALRFALRVTAPAVRTPLVLDSNAGCFLRLELQVEGSFEYVSSNPEPGDPSDPTDPTDPSDPGTGGGSGGGSLDLTEVIDSIEIVQGHLEEISGNIVEIKDTVDDIKVEIQDTKEQLEDPSSPIWEAAGSKIEEAVTGLFVPDQEELDAAMDEIETILEEKLGDTYVVIERVESYEEELVSSFTGGGRQYSFDFPGISVPMGGTTYTIVPPQSVNIENDAFIVFRDLLGIGVALLCGFSAVHIMHDFFICIISGVSYWGFIRGRHDR